MSPEQVRCEAADHRSDIFSFGLVLYEMLSGRRAFQGESSVEVMNAILKDDPPESPSTVPTAVDRVVRRCLEKEPSQRFQSAADIGFALQVFLGSQESIASLKRQRPGWPKWSLAAATVLIGATAWWLNTRADRSKTSDQPTLHRLTGDSGLTTDGAISRDGNLVAYASDRADPNNLDIWVQQIDGSGAVRLTDDPADDSEPTFSPDGTQIAFRSEREPAGIYEVPTLGGDARLVVSDGRHPRFSPDGQFLMYSIFSGLRGARTGTGYVKLFVQPVATGAGAVDIGSGCTVLSAAAAWSPDSRYILFDGICEKRRAFWLSRSDGTHRTATHLMDFLPAKNMARLDIDAWLDGPSRLLLPLASVDAAYIAALPITRDGENVAGPLQPLTFGTGAEERASASTNGRIVLSSVSRSSQIWRQRVDQNGSATSMPEQLTATPSFNYNPELSKDGKQLAFLSDRGDVEDLQCRNLATGKQRLLDSGDGMRPPVFDSSGNRIMYLRYRKSTKKWTLEEKSAFGGLPERSWEKYESGPQYPVDWSADGFSLLLRWVESGHASIRILDLRTLQATEFLSDPHGALWNGRFSPDGRWAAFQYLEGAHPKLYIAPVRESPVPRSEWILATDGDAKAQFSPDGRLLYFLSGRDGFLCIWAQRLSPDMHPIGKAFAVYHSHQCRRSLGNTTPALLNLSVAPGMIVFNETGFTGNIWRLDPPNAKKP
jgi:Tol biopolymer transport system component